MVQTNRSQVASNPVKRERSAVYKAASGRLLTDALQASPHPEVEIEPGRTLMPVRSVKL